MRSPWMYFLLLVLTRIQYAFAIRCYSCANEFIVWQWRHFFLKRNYALASSDQECVRRDYTPESTQGCHTTCFIFSLNGTNRETGQTRTLGVGRGCSSQFLTDDQHMHLGLGTHTKLSEVGTYLPADFDKLEIFEHWCFCATDYCNTQVCYSRPFGSSEFANSYIGKRLQYSSYNSDWRYRNCSSGSFVLFLLLLLPLSLFDS
uniref:Protein quiver n=1 Tax=Haemonchus contortus TaxID=6289 RepID=A0A7I5EDE4_HAECO